MPEFKEWEVVLWDDDHGDPKCGYKIIDSDGKYVLGGYDPVVLERIVHEHNTYPVLLEALRAAKSLIEDAQDIFGHGEEDQAVLEQLLSALSIAGEGE